MCKVITLRQDILTREHFLIALGNLERQLKTANNADKVFLNKQIKRTRKVMNKLFKNTEEVM